MVAVISEEGFRRLTEAEVSEIARTILDGRMQLPNGPQAPVV